MQPSNKSTAISTEQLEIHVMPQQKIGKKTAENKHSKTNKHAFFA